MTESHITVLLQETVQAILEASCPLNYVLDGTLGAGGHADLLLQKSDAQLLGLDLDPQAITLASERLQKWGQRIHIRQGSYLDFDQYCDDLGWDRLDGFYLDLGVSSMQFDTAERGFSFRFDAPLDMRFNPDAHTSTNAHEIINGWDESQLTYIFQRYGEERFSRQIARKIIQQRPLHTTWALADLIKQTVPHKKNKQGSQIHPATKVFQALRIAVNDELHVVESIIPKAIARLNSGGRLAIISFHSLEDRLVKQAFKEACDSFEPPPGMASLGRKKAIATLITNKPITPSAEELAFNARSRSAKLRVLEKI